MSLMVYPSSVAFSTSFASFSSKKGDKLAISADGDLYVLDLRNGKMNNLTVNLVDGVMVDDTLPVWAPRGDRIAFVGRYEAFSSELYTISSSGKTKLKSVIFIAAPNAGGGDDLSAYFTLFVRQKKAQRRALRNAVNRL
jgi:Tol biopolymer transport system component